MVSTGRLETALPLTMPARAHAEGACSILAFGVEEGWGGVGVVVDAEFNGYHFLEGVH